MRLTVQETGSSLDATQTDSQRNTYAVYIRCRQPVSSGQIQKTHKIEKVKHQNN